MPSPNNFKDENQACRRSGHLRILVLRNTRSIQTALGSAARFDHFGDHMVVVGISSSLASKIPDTESRHDMNKLVSHAIFLLALCFAADGHARAVLSPDIKTLLKGSGLILVGQVKSVKPSGITTELTYPTWRDVVFEWLKVEVEVIEPIKGTAKGDIVRTLMLSARGSGPMFNPPGMVHPKVGQYHLLCLLPTRFEGVFASFTAPFDDNRAIFLLDRGSWTDGATYYKDGKEVAFHEQSDLNRALWNLVDDKGAISAVGAETIRKRYRAEIATPAPEDAVIHLIWKKETSESGWQWNVPDLPENKPEGVKRGQPHGPVTKP